MNALKQLALLAALGLGLLSSPAQAWWNADFKHRTKVTLNTSANGVETKETLSGVVVPVRLHSGNFDFLGTQADGRDVRVVAADDKTPLKFWIERFDGVNELGVLWVQLPSLAAGTDKNVVYVYAGSEQAAAEVTSPALFDAAMKLAVTFAGQSGLPAADARGAIQSEGPLARNVNGLIGPSAKLDGQGVVWPMGELRVPAAGPYSVSFWIKPANGDGILVSHGALTLSLAAGQLTADFNGIQIPSGEGGQLPPSAWAHVALTVGAGKLTLYVNGVQSAQADLAAAGEDIAGPLMVAQGITGEMEQLEVADTVRSPEWIKLAHAAQSAEAKLVMAVTQTEDTAEEAEGAHEQGHFAILFDNLTLDAWIVIVILGIMFVIAAWVMYDKSVLVSRADKDNRRFLENFRSTPDVLQVSTQGMKHSSLARLYNAGLRELVKREVGEPGAAPLSGASLDAVRAAVDADLIRESHNLNSKIVLLTIAISGGPFLGLLGTVVGVMITFAAIAAAGDVNVNAIAPGIAAALLATVAGLAVAIPALFGYNYLAARIKNISSDMGIFVDEFVTRVAEVHGAR
jgi:biopolymer transport protein ExbB